FDGTNCVGDGMAGCAITDLVTVGKKPAGDGRWGQSDLAGNVAEGVLDWSAAYASTCTDCANLTAATDRATRGGNFGQTSIFMRTGARGAFTPANRSHGLGVRCARAP